MSLSKYRIRPEAQRDLEEFARYLAKEGGANVGMRFLDSSRASFTALGDTPNLGTPTRSRNPEFAELKRWRVSGFSNYLIFYLPLANGADILRVVHGAQDWWALLDVDS